MKRIPIRHRLRETVLTITRDNMGLLSIVASSRIIDSSHRRRDGRFHERAAARASAWPLSDFTPPLSLPAKSRGEPAPLSGDSNNDVAPNAIPMDAPVFSNDVVEDIARPGFTHFRHSCPYSRVSGTHHYHTGQPCSGVLTNKVWISLSLSLSLPPSPLSFSLSIFVFLSWRYQVPLIRASQSWRGRRDNRTALRSSHSRIMQFSDVLMRRRR